ncbi:hypothetical protein ACEQPO_14755 [Bacillus sp. SL00103]
MYRYFDSKEALVNILYQRSLSAFIEKNEHKQSRSKGKYSCVL